MEPLSHDHVAIAVASLDEAVPLFERLLGLRSSPVEELPRQGVRVTFIGALELLEPLDPEGTVARFLARRGPGLHHVAYRVSDLGTTLDRLRREGYQLIDQSPRPGARGHRVAFLHPKSTSGVLVELVEVVQSTDP